jgi:hypothetical protein
VSEKNSKDFIESLSQKLEPVNVNWSAESRAVLWITLNLSFTFFLMQLIGGFSFAEHLKGWRLAEFFLGLSSILILGYIAFLGIVPGASNKKKIKIGFTSFLVFVGFFVFAMIADFQPTAPGIYRWQCNIEILVLSLVPGLQFAYFLYKDILFSNKTSFVLAGVVSSLVPAFYMNYICPFHANHALMHHFGPVALFALVYSIIFFQIKNRKV